MITIIYPKNARLYCMHNEKVIYKHSNGTHSLSVRGRHTIKNGETGYQCPQVRCRMKVCEHHWEEHQANHMMEKLAR